MPNPLWLLLLLLIGSGTQAAENRAHHGDGRYLNPHTTAIHGSLFGFLRARFGGDWQGYDPQRDQVPTTQPDPLAAGAVSTEAVVTWIGHSTVLLQHQGINVLTDPIFTKRASPLAFAGPARITPAALTIAQLPPIHAVVISHDHYDHLDAATIKALGNGPSYFIPLGMSRWFERRGIAREQLVELDWWQSRELQTDQGTLTITATPSQHFSGRGLTDRNKTLWASWHIQWPSFSAWFGGDTGYNEVQFRQIGERFGRIDLGIVPIGAYAPRWFMSAVHVDPAEAIKIHQDIRARRSFGIHWGAFLLSGEGVMTPPAELAAAREQAELAPDAFVTLAVGETRRYPVATPAQLP